MTGRPEEPAVCAQTESLVASGSAPASCRRDHSSRGALTGVTDISPSDVAPRPDVASLVSIREGFPALRRLQGDVQAAYFDAPGGTQVPESVARAVAEQMLRHNANAHWAYATSRELDEVLEESRAAVADFVGGAPDEIVFGPNMTTLTFHMARALGRRLGPGDEIVVTELDHDANVAPWRDLESERGIVVRTVPLDVETADLDWEALDRLVSGRTPGPRLSKLSCSWMPSTSLLTSGSTWPRCDATCWPAPPTSSTAHTSECCGVAPVFSRKRALRSWRPRRRPRRNAGRLERPITRGSLARAPRSSTSPDSGAPATAAHVWTRCSPSCRGGETG